MSRHETNASMETADTFSVQIFSIKLAIAFLRFTFVSPKLFEHRTLLHPSASIAEGPGPPFVLMAAFLIISSSTPANMIGWTSCGTPVSKTSLHCKYVTIMLRFGSSFSCIFYNVRVMLLILLFKKKPFLWFVWITYKNNVTITFLFWSALWRIFHYVTVTFYR